MYFPGAAQGMQCGDYNSMYMSLSHQRNGPDYENLYNNSAGYEDIENDSEVSHLWGWATRTIGLHDMYMLVRSKA